MARDDQIELKFRLFDGTDIGPNKFDLSTSVGSIKETILARWPAGKEITPKSINDVKLINGGRVLENNQTIAESRMSVGELPGTVVTMHAVVRTPVVDKSSEKHSAKFPKSNRCECTIL